MSEPRFSAKEALENSAKRELNNYKHAKAKYKRALLRGDIAGCMEMELQMDMFWELATKSHKESLLEDPV